MTNKVIIEIIESPEERSVLINMDTVGEPKLAPMIAHAMILLYQNSLNEAMAESGLIHKEGQA